MKNLSYAEAMNIVGNGGATNREGYHDELYIKLDCTGVVTTFKEVDGALEHIEDFVATIDDIKAQDWYLRELPQPKDTRTHEEVDFDEEMLSIMESLDTMLELENIDDNRKNLLFELIELVSEYGYEFDNEEEEEDEVFDEEDYQDFLEIHREKGNSLKKEAEFIAKLLAQSLR